MPQLLFHEAGRRLFVVPLRPGRTIVGRADTCDLALPHESVSRVHCTIDGRRDGFWISDRSRHGTTVNGEKVEDARKLVEGDALTIGIYAATFSAKEDPVLRSPTATVPLAAAIHEELVEADEAKIAACRAEVRFVRGPHEGRAVPLLQQRTSIGGPSSTIEIDDKLPRASVYVKVVRGRPMIEPGAAAAVLAGTRVRDITPALPGEEVRIGDHGFVVEITTVEERGRELECFGDMVGRTDVMKCLFGVLQRISTHDAPVLLLGESGTGKELAARGLHQGGPRFEGPFIALNCAAVAESLVESELFGHEKGAFTGAASRQDGAFQAADGGTLFLDEIGEMRLELQAKLLRALESGEVRRVGATAAEYPDVRLVAATHRNLQDMVRDGRFRQDLYFRLAVLTVRLPSLRERRDDIPVIAQTLLARHHPNARLTPDAIKALCTHDWPGNVRELRNVLTRAVILGGDLVSAGDLAFNPWAFDDAAPRGPAGRPYVGEPDPDSPDGLERRELVQALEAANGNRTKAARQLGIPRSSLLYKLQKHGLP